MRKSLVVLGLTFLLTAASSAFAAGTVAVTDNPAADPSVKGLDFYEKNYFICGTGDTSAKWQVSFKYSIFYPSRAGVYFSYTQTCRWDLFNKPSAPFRDTNFSPSLFYSLDSKNNIFNNLDLRAVDFMQCGIRHKSNGKDGADSRAINYFYGSGQVSSDTKITVGLYGKYMGDFFDMDDTNRDIMKYMGNWEARLFFRLKNEQAEWFDREELYLSYGAHNLGKTAMKYAWYEIGVQMRILTAYVQPMLYVQFWHGYGENMLEYNKKDTCLRAGITFN